MCAENKEKKSALTILLTSFSLPLPSRVSRPLASFHTLLHTHSRPIALQERERERRREEGRERKRLTLEVVDELRVRASARAPGHGPRLLDCAMSVTVRGQRGRERLNEAQSAHQKERRD